MKKGPKNIPQHTRAWLRLYRQALRQQAREAKRPCTGCAMHDPEAMVADPGMRHKLLQCLRGAAQFYCHDGLPTTTHSDGSAGSYLPPTMADGRIDVAQLTPCGGFLRWAVRYRGASLREQIAAVDAHQRRMCERYLASDLPHAAEFRRQCRGKVALFQEALNMQSLGILWMEDV